MNDSPHRWGRALALSASLIVPMAVGGCRKATTEVPKPPEPVVYFSLPVSRQVTDYEDFSGRTEAVKAVEVRARVTGYLERFKFEEGLEVKENDVLFEIDARPYKATLDQATAEVAQAQAHLAKADADFQRARGTYVREAISKSEYDIAAAAFAESRAAIGIAEAKRDTAKLNYEWTRVTAPISGQVSRRMVDPGNLVQADVTPLTTIVAIDKVYINFDIDERTLLRLRRLVSEGTLKTRDQKQLMVLAALADEDRQNFPHSGFVDFSDNRVDPGTGTLRLRGLFENPPLITPSPGRFVRRMMAPGLFARVRLPIGDPHQALLVPEGAIGNDQGQKFLFVIDADNVVHRQYIEVNALHEGLREIKSGLKPADRVVVSGLQRVRDMLKVDPKPYSSLKKSDSAIAKEKAAAAKAVGAKADASRTGARP